VYGVVSVHVNEVLILFACEHFEGLFCRKTDVLFSVLNCTVPTVNAFGTYPFSYEFLFVWSESYILNTAGRGKNKKLKSIGYELYCKW
jgi:hypothetical protein